MNVEIGTEVTQFPEKEYRNGIFFAVYNTNLSKSLEASSCSSLAAVLTPRLGLINRYSRFTFVVSSSFSTRTFRRHEGLAER
jgi:hypothetical protein